MSLLINKLKRGFSIRLEQYTPKRSVRLIHPSEYALYDLNPTMTYEEAKNQIEAFKKRSQSEKQKLKIVASKLALKSIQDSIYLPPNLIVDFEEDLKIQYRKKHERLETILQHWRSAQKLISSLNIDPSDYYENRFKIFDYFEKQLWSLDYIKRITRILNMWGAFGARRSKSYFVPIPKLGAEAHSIVDNRDKNKLNRRKESSLFTFEKLNNLKITFLHENLEPHWNWMFISLWFGLRPSETDSLKNSENFKIEQDKGNDIAVLHVYQNKLKAQTSKENRWKIIPVNEPEQKIALDLIKLKNFKRPLTKTIQRLLDDEHLNTYSPRKSFTDLMLSRGYGLEDISVFLGHSDISTTWRHYKSKKLYTLPVKKSA